jgi:hypothetical protein
VAAAQQDLEALPVVAIRSRRTKNHFLELRRRGDYPESPTPGIQALRIEPARGRESADGLA